jgi:hypothetical protein
VGAARRPRRRAAAGERRREGALAARLKPERTPALAASSAAWLPRLAARGWADDYYLAGSAALALYCGHRPVTDLDLMSGTNRLAPADRRDLLGDLLELDTGLRVETARDGYLFVRLPDGPALRFFYYPYPLADPLEKLDGFAVASAVDLGLMKLGALISRGTRRDFVDLFELARRIPVAALLTRAGEKFGHVGDFALQAGKALADFSEAEDEPLPPGAPAWSAVSAWALVEARRVGGGILAAAGRGEDGGSP